MKLTEKQLKSIVENSTIKTCKTIFNPEQIKTLQEKYSDENKSISYEKLIDLLISINIDFTKELVYSSLKSVLEEANLLSAFSTSEAEK